MSVYDPCCGSAGMLILAKEYVQDHGGDESHLSVYGQEDNGSAWAMARMNLLMHGVADGVIHHGDTLADPQHVQGGQLQRFEVWRRSEIGGERDMGLGEIHRP